MLNVIAVGSCRVYRPLESLDQAGHIRLLNKIDPRWFVHASAGARQFVEVISGEAAVPVHLARLILETAPVGRTIDFDGRDALAAADVIVVEISSFKTVQVEGWELNQHLAWHEDKLENSPIMASAVRGVSSYESIKADILGIRDRTNRPVLTVDHLHFLLEDGRPLSGRPQITEMLTLLRAEEAVPFFSTRPVIEHHGQSVALKDWSHYNDQFIDIVGRAMLPHLTGASDKETARHIVRARDGVYA